MSETPGSYKSAWLITPSNTQTVQGPVQGNGVPIPYCDGFLALTAGSVTATLRDDRARPAVTFQVLAGTIYPMALSFVFTGSTANLLGLLR